MTTDEALEYCKRFDDPKLREQMGTDFSRAMGTVGALLALRAELAALQAKCRELDEYLDSVARVMTAVIKADLKTGGDPTHTARRRDDTDKLRSKLRELGLVEVNDDPA